LFSQKFDKLEEKKQLLVAEETILMRKALESENPHDLIKAQEIYNKRNGKNNEVQSFFVDPTANVNTFGYLSQPQIVNDFTLRKMAKGSPIIKSIIETRVEQVRDFLEPQADKYSSGFVIRKKRKYYAGDDDEEVSKEDQTKIQLMTEFMLRGCMDESLDNICDDLGTWGEKTVKDALTLAKISTEIVYNNARTLPKGFIPVDAATIYFANIYEDDGSFEPTNPNIQKPKYVQVIDSVIKNEYLDEEMMFAVRNSSTDMHMNGYGESELEVLIGTVTAMLQGDAYNSNIFKVGSTPSGIFRVQGNINESRLREFKAQWSNSMAGYQNNGKLAFLEADKMEFVDMSKSNRDMEYSKFQEYLIKLACAVYKISPEEIGFNVQGGGSKSMFQDSGDARIKYSREKGLRPLLRFIQKQINDKIINKIDNSFEFVFVGIDAETEEKEIEMAIKKASTFKSLKEIRMERGLPPEIEEGDMILNPVWLQSQQLKVQQEQMQAPNRESNEFMEMQEDDGSNPFEKSWQDEENPMAEEFKKFVKEDLIIT